MSTNSTDQTSTEKTVQEESSETTESSQSESQEGTSTEENVVGSENESHEVNETAENDLEESVEELPSVEELLKERAQLQAKVEEWKGLYYKINDAFQRKNTEVQETRKRLERLNEVNQAKLRGQVVANIFSPFENLKRSIDACTKAGVDDGLTGGLVMVKDEFWGAFEKLGLEEVPGVGSLFNPNIHEALTTMPVMDPVLNDTIVQVYTTGYRINDTVIRASQVIVGKYTAPPKTETSESSENSETSEANVSEDSSDS